MHGDSHYAGLWIAVKNSGRFSLLFMFFGHLRKRLKRIEDIDEEKKEKKNPWLLENKTAQNCQLSINKRESFLNADKII